MIRPKMTPIQREYLIQLRADVNSTRRRVKERLHLDKCPFCNGRCSECCWQSSEERMGCGSYLMYEDRATIVINKLLERG